MHALEAKTCENRRFRGRFQKNLVVWKQFQIESNIYRIIEFQKNLVVWKLDWKTGKPMSFFELFQKNLVVWKLVMRFQNKGE